VMLRSVLRHQFPESKRYSEDYLLWLRICLDGHTCVRSSANLSYRHKHAFGAGGLSAQLWNMEKGELDVFRTLLREKRIGGDSWLLSSTVSIIKFMRRVLVSYVRRTFS